MKHATRAVAWLALLALAGCGSDNSNIKPPQELAPIVPQLDVTRLWTASVGQGANDTGVRMRPAYEDGTVYVASADGYMKAIDLDTGDLIWRKTRPWRVDQDISYAGGPVVEDGVLVIATLDGHVYAFEAKSGKALWQTAIGSSVLSAPVFTDFLVLVRSDDGNLTALNRADGTQAWVHDQTTVPALSLRGTGNIVVGEGAVYFASDDGQLVALLQDSGQPLWTYTLSRGDGTTAIQQLNDADGHLVLDNGVLYATAYHGRLTAVDARSGRMLWDQPLSSYVGVALKGSTVVGVDDASNVWAWDARSGGDLWKQDALQWRWLSAPAIQQGNAIVAGFKGYLHWLDLADGALVARFRASHAPIRSRPVVLADGRVLVEDVQGRITALKVSPR